MLKPQDIEISVYRTPNGDSMKILHKPTGVFRAANPPMSKPGKFKHQALREIEAELLERGLREHLLPTRRRQL